MQIRFDDHIWSPIIISLLPHQNRILRSAHPFYFAAQFHPEFKSRPQNPSPPFFGFVLAAAKMFPAGLAKRKAAAAPAAAKKMRK